MIFVIVESIIFVKIGIPRFGGLRLARAIEAQSAVADSPPSDLTWDLTSACCVVAVGNAASRKTSDDAAPERWS